MPPPPPGTSTCLTRGGGPHSRPRSSSYLGAAGGAWLVRRRAPTNLDTAESMAVLSTPRGQRARLALPDGSRVLLGPASTLQYSSRAFAANRELFLDGEAFFEWPTIRRGRCGS